MSSHEPLATTLVSSVTAANRAAFGTGPTDLTAAPASSTMPPADCHAPRPAWARRAIVHTIVTGADGSTSIVVRLKGRQRVGLTWHDAGASPTSTLTSTVTESRYVVECWDLDALYDQFTTYTDPSALASVKTYVTLEG